MRFVYQYRTRDNVEHQAEIDAADRESAFAALKAQGIRPARMWEKPGIINSLFGKCKRWIAICVLALVAAVFAALFTRTARTLDKLEQSEEQAPRHQIYGDPAILHDIEKGRTEKILPLRGDRILAWFAQPGLLACPVNAPLDHPTVELYEALGSVKDISLEISSEEPREARELKQIVNWMRSEMNAYLKNGNGNVRSYFRRLKERTMSELQIYESTKLLLENEKSAAVWELKNEALRQIGLKTIPAPEGLD